MRKTLLTYVKPHVQEDPLSMILGIGYLGAMLEQEGLNVGYLAYNTMVAPYDNPKVRKALNMAINKQAILDAVFATHRIAAGIGTHETVFSELNPDRVLIGNCPA